MNATPKIPDMASIADAIEKKQGLGGLLGVRGFDNIDPENEPDAKKTLASPEKQAEIQAIAQEMGKGVGSLIVLSASPANTVVGEDSLLAERLEELGELATSMQKLVIDLTLIEGTS